MSTAGPMERRTRRVATSSSRGNVHVSGRRAERARLRRPDHLPGVLRHPQGQDPERVPPVAAATADPISWRPPPSMKATILVVSRSNPENDWVTKMRDDPLIGIPFYAIFDPRTGTGAVLTDIHSTPGGPRYATRKDFVYGEDVTIADWTIPTTGLPRYRDGVSQE
ncbi:Uma2 family endonuclease [Streptomyces sp. NBC_01538]|uniref:Uma2 family endonuclease n=1 Tax=Streptomyces sp. NBC_01538 TaxID=2903897 RepID=UPI0038649D95